MNRFSLLIFVSAALYLHPAVAADAYTNLSEAVVKTTVSPDLLGNDPIDAKAFAMFPA